MAQDIQAQIDAINLALKVKADLDPATGKLRRDQTADATPADVDAWLTAGVKVTAPTTTPVVAAPTTSANLLTAATVAALAAGVQAPAGFTQAGPLAAGTYVLTGQVTATGYDIGAKMTRTPTGGGDVGGYVKFQNGSQTIAFALKEAGYFAIAGSNGSVKIANASLTKTA